MIMYPCWFERQWNSDSCVYPQSVFLTKVNHFACYCIWAFTLSIVCMIDTVKAWIHFDLYQSDSEGSRIFKLVSVVKEDTVFQYEVEAIQDKTQPDSWRITYFYLNHNCSQSWNIHYPHFLSFLLVITLLVVYTVSKEIYYWLSHESTL